MSVRVWLAGAVVSALVAGTALGIAVCRGMASSERDAAELASADREFLQRFASEFALSGQQVTLLGAILRRRAHDETSIFRRNLPSLPAAVQDELGGARRAADKRIEFMLDPSQRARYEQLRQAQDSRR